MTPLPVRPRPTARLTLQPLEDRATPATASYAAGSQTLTVTALDLEQVAVAPALGKPTGYLTVTANGASVFDSALTRQSVRNLVVRFNGAGIGGLTVGSDVRLGGDLTVTGAQFHQTADLLGTVGGNFTYTAAPGPDRRANTGMAFDQVTLGPAGQVGGNVNVQLGAGENTVNLRGGTIRGNLTVTGGADQDTVVLADAADLSVNGWASFNLGNGTNKVNGVGAPVHKVQVRYSFTYTGGTGNDTFDLDGSGTPLDVGGDATFNLGTPWVTDSNLVAFEALSVGRSLTVNGTPGADQVLGSGNLSVGGGLTANLGGGDNVFNTNARGAGPNQVGGSFNYAGGAGSDAVTLDALTVGRNLNVGLGEAGAGSQSLNVGTATMPAVPASGAPLVTVFGSVSVTDGSAGSTVVLSHLYVGWSLSVLAGAGDDQVFIDDTDVAGWTSIDLGAGNDNLSVETGAGNGGGPLTSPTTFGGTVSVRGGDGDDQVHLSDDGDGSTKVQFGDRLSVIGGKGADTLTGAPENVFEVTGSFLDVETKPLVP